MEIFTREEQLEEYRRANMYIPNNVTLEKIEDFYNTAVGERETKVLFTIIPDHDTDDIEYVYANNEMDAVYIYHKMCSCLVYDTVAVPIYRNVILEGYTHKEGHKITFKRQCELNKREPEGENPKVNVFENL